MKTKTNRPAELKGSIAASAYPVRISPMLFRRAVTDTGKHYKADALCERQVMRFARSRLDRVLTTITRDPTLDLEVAVAAAIMMCANLRLREVVGLRYRGADAELIMPKRGDALAWIRLPARKGNRRTRAIRLEQETTSLLKAYLDWRPMLAKQRGDADPALFFPRGRRDSDRSTNADQALRGAFWRRMCEARVLPRDPEPRYIRARLVLDVLLPRSIGGLESGRLVIPGRAVNPGSYLRHGKETDMPRLYAVAEVANLFHMEQAAIARLAKARLVTLVAFGGTKAWSVVRRRYSPFLYFCGKKSCVAL